MSIPESEAATQPQRDYIRSLATQRQTDTLSEDQRAWLGKFIDAENHPTTLTPLPLRKNAAGRIIDTLKELPAIQRTYADGGLPDVPEGRYALLGEHPDDAQVMFWKVDRPTEGKWAGKTFLKPVYGGPGGLQYGKNVYGQTRAIILAAIAADPQAAARRFGLELGYCGVCGSPLTNDVSREYGIGPVCRGKTGW